VADLTITEEPDGSLTLTDGTHTETLDPFMAMATPRGLLPAWFAERKALAAEEPGAVDEALAAGARKLEDGRG
jgi:hypothetical protein